MIKPIMNVVPRYRVTTLRILQNVRLFSDKTAEPEIPVNSLRETYSASTQAATGHIYDKKPFKMRCEAGKIYSWCLCGRSKSQPLCDGTHKIPFWNITLRPVRFTVKDTKDYWLCNCKQTSNRPFCDGTHLREDIQEKPSR